MAQTLSLSPNTSGQINMLHDLGLTNNQVKTIGTRISAAYNRATDHDAVNAAGSYAYFEAVRAVRDTLCPFGWEIHRQHNLEFTRNPVADIMLVISSGDIETGIETGSPKTKNPKGKETQKVIEHNRRQPFLFSFMNQPLANELQLGPIWMFLYHIDFKKREMRMELSLPIKIDFEELKVSGWDSRIIFAPIKFDNTPSPINPDLTPEVEFDIKVRG